jgi:hypothetical protein
VNRIRLANWLRIRRLRQVCRTCLTEQSIELWMHPTDSEVFLMRRAFTTWLVVTSMGLAGMFVEGCKQAAPAPARPVVRSAPPVNTAPDFAGGSLRVENNVDAGTAPHQSGRRRTQVQTVQAQPTDAQAALVAAAQRQQDAKLLQQQQASSQKQQQELNRQIEQNLQVQRQQQAEADQRIQDAPEQPITQPTQGLRIQDNPAAPPTSPLPQPQPVQPQV